MGAGVAKLHGLGHDAEKREGLGPVAAVYQGLYAKIPCRFWKGDPRLLPVCHRDPHPPGFKNLQYILILAFRICIYLIFMSLKPRVKPGA